MEEILLDLVLGVCAAARGTLRSSYGRESWGKAGSPPISRSDAYVSPSGPCAQQPMGRNQRKKGLLHPP